MGTEELYTLNVVEFPIMGIITNFDYTPPIYNLLAHFSYVIFNSGVAIRFPAMVAGVALIPAMYYLGLQYKDEVVGLYCAGITAILVPMIYYSQYARAYSLSMLCFVIALIFYLKLKSGGDNLKTRAIFWILVVVNLYVHLFTLIPLALLCLDLLTSKKHWLCGIGATICSLPIAGVLLSVLSTRNGGSFNYGASPLQMAVLTFPEFFNSIFLNVLVLAGVGAWLCKDKIRWNLMIIAAVTLIVGIIGSAITPTFPRYYMTISLIILLLSSVGLVELTTLLNKKVGYNLTYVVMIGIFLVFIWQEWPNLMSHYFIQQY